MKQEDASASPCFVISHVICNVSGLPYSSSRPVLEYSVGDVPYISLNAVEK